jgi:hypothetical protein
MPSVAHATIDLVPATTAVVAYVCRACVCLRLQDTAYYVYVESLFTWTVFHTLSTHPKMLLVHALMLEWRARRRVGRPNYGRLAL